MKKKPRVAVRPLKNKDWEPMVEEIINSPILRSFYYPEDGEVYITIEKENYRSVVLKKNGTWSFE